MALEAWLALAAAGALVAAALTQMVAWLRASRRWSFCGSSLRLAAVLGLAVALVLAAARLGRWAPSEIRQAALSLALVVAVAQLAAQARRDPVPDFGADLLAAGLGLTAVAVWPGGPPAGFFERGIAHDLQWGLSILGVGSSAVAGSASLALALRAGAPDRGRDRPRPRAGDLESRLEEATMVAAILLGSGLALGAWWSWRVTGRWPAGDPRAGWLAAAWLLAVMSLVAWRVEKQPVRWAALLAALSAGLGLLGLLAAQDLQSMLMA